MSWHADSTLEHFSTIGVYHVTTSATATDTNTNIDTKQNIAPQSAAGEGSVDSSWRIAMRVHYDAEGPNVGKVISRAAEMKQLDASRITVPPVVFALPSKSAYFLLDEFNHHHQHSGQSVSQSGVLKRCCVLFFLRCGVV